MSLRSRPSILPIYLSRNRLLALLTAGTCFSGAPAAAELITPAPMPSVDSADVVGHQLPSVDAMQVVRPGLPMVAAARAAAQPVVAAGAHLANTFTRTGDPRLGAVAARAGLGEQQQIVSLVMNRDYDLAVTSRVLPTSGVDPAVSEWTVDAQPGLQARDEAASWAATQPALAEGAAQMLATLDNLPAIDEAPDPVRLGTAFAEAKWQLHP